MTRAPKPAPRATVSPRSGATQPPVIDQTQIRSMADRALAGDVVQTASVEEFCALIEELARRGHPLKRRTEWEQKAAPFTFLVE